VLHYKKVDLQNFKQMLYVFQDHETAFSRNQKTRRKEARATPSQKVLGPYPNSKLNTLCAHCKVNLILKHYGFTLSIVPEIASRQKILLV